VSTFLYDHCVREAGTLKAARCQARWQTKSLAPDSDQSGRDPGE